MKKIFNTLFLLLMTTAFVACSSDNETVKSAELDITARNLNGNWKLSTLNGEAISGDAFFYIVLQRIDTKFEIYNYIESGVAHTTTGTFTLTNEDDQTIISSVYDNTFNRPWNNEYIVTSLTKTEMVWKTVGKDEIQVFVKVD